MTRASQGGCHSSSEALNQDVCLFRVILGLCRADSCVQHPHRPLVVCGSASVSGSPVKWRKVHHTVTLLELPQFYLLTLAMGPELDFDGAVAQEGCRATGRVLLRTNLVSFHPPRLSKLVHVKFEKAVASHGVVTFVAVVVATEAAEASAQVRGGYDLHKTIAVPRDLQTCK